MKFHVWMHGPRTLPTVKKELLEQDDFFLLLILVKRTIMTVIFQVIVNVARVNYIFKSGTI